MTNTKPKLKLIGEDGNVFSIIGRARKIAKRENWSKEKIEEFTNKCMSSDYDNALRTCMEYFNVH